MKVKFLFCVLLCSTISLLAQNNFVYTNDDVTPNTVSAFRANFDGSLTLISGSPFLTGGNGGGDGRIDPEKITTATVASASFLYAGNTADGTISGFSINPQTGALTAVPGSPFPLGLTDTDISLASSPNGQFLFASDDTSPSVHVFSIASATGSLSEVPGSPFNVGAPADGLKVSPSGHFLAAGLGSTHTVGVFAIGNQGTLTPAPGSPFATTALPTGVEINCKSNRVFVSNGGSGAIDAYQMAENGSLTPVPGSPFPSGAAFNVSALTLTPDNQFLFTSDTFSSAVSSLAVAPNGSLRPVPASPFAADDFAGRVETTLAGNFVYVSLFASDSVDAWSIKADGTLTPVPGHPFFAGQSEIGQSSIAIFPAPSCSAAD